MTADEELRALFVEEIRRRRETLSDETASVDEKRRALHALKGAAGLVGEATLADSIARYERRVRAGDVSAIAAADGILAEVEAAYDRGELAPSPKWPRPPDDLEATEIDEPLRPTYASEMRERVSRIDTALANQDDPDASLTIALRELHAMKGAAGAAADEVTTWFCHGLEAELREGRGDTYAAARALETLASMRGVLGEVFVDAPRALARLRGAIDPAAKPMAPSSGRMRVAANRSTRPPSAVEEDPQDDGLTRIPVSALDRLVERVGHLGRVGAQLASSVDQSRASARALRQLSTTLAEALRLIGPPRPWGAPAAAIARVERGAAIANHVADELEFSHATARDRTDDLSSETAATSSELRQLRRTRAGWLFDRVRAAIEGQARREGKLLRVMITGADLQVDRRLLEQLVDPVLQLARNALAHGFESPGARVAAGKPAEGALSLSASFAANHLRIVVEDDGAGVDVELVRRRAVEARVVPADVAAEATDEALFDLLFVPGFTTRVRADALAGRGMGLDLAQGALRRVGGAMRIASKPGRGVTATLEVPTESSSMTVLWVTSRGDSYALSAREVERVSLPEGAESPASLASLILGGASDRPGFVLDLSAELRGARLRIGVERVDGLEDVALRPLSPIVIGAGPYRAAVVRPDGRLHLVLSAEGLAELSL